MKRARRKETIKNNTQILEKQDENSIFPIDVIIEILVKLPPKTLARLICVSKLWYSTILGKYFIGLFVTRSVKRLLLAFNFGDKMLLHLASHDEVNSCLVNDKNTICAGAALNQCYRIFATVRGLVCCVYGRKVVICNPGTGQVVALPYIRTRRRGVSIFFGYDSVEDVYKVFCTTVLSVCGDSSPVVSDEHQVFTLGVKQKTWRMINCQVPHCPASNGLCKNGIIYYAASSNNEFKSFFLVGFNVRLEEFSLLKAPEGVNVEFRSYKRPGLVYYHLPRLVYYHKNIALLEDESNDGKVTLWVLEDVEKQEWSEVRIVVPCWKDLAGGDYFSCMGTISTGELVFGKANAYTRSESFSMIYYDHKKCNARRAEIKGLGDLFDFESVFLDHVESPMFLSR